MQVYFTPYSSSRNNRNQWWANIKIKPRPTIEASLDDTTFQEDTNDNPPTLCEFEENQEVELHSEDIGDEEDDENDSSIGSDSNNLEGEREEEGDEKTLLLYDDGIDEDIIANDDEVWLRRYTLKWLL